MIQPPQVMKQIDETFVSHIDNILNHEHGTELEAKQPRENGPLLSEPSPTNNNVSFAKACEVAVDDEIPELVKVALSLDQPKNELHTEREYKLYVLYRWKMFFNKQLPVQLWNSGPTYC
ncbi:hypothetical protein AAC387_Pa10g0694 [Persea americana]